MARQITFAFERRPSPLFGSVYQPLAFAELWSRKLPGWVRVAMLVDTGADYTLLPKVYASHLGIRLDRDAHLFNTMGIGGSERVYLVRRWSMRLGPWKRQIPLGFLTRDDIPPLLGRQACLETFKLTFVRHRTIIAVR